MVRMSEQDYVAYQARHQKQPPVASKGVELEGQLHDEILAECRRRGWIALHGRMDVATGRTVGEPDFTILADNGRVLLVEAKSRAGKLRPEQAALHAWARKLGHTVHVVRTFEEFIAALTTP